MGVLWEKHLKDKYGEESVTLLLNWENLIQKMADFQNDRRFILKCIKVGITSVS